MPEEKRFICQINGASEKQNNPWLLYMCQAPRIALAFQRDTQGTSCVQWMAVSFHCWRISEHFFGSIFEHGTWKIWSLLKRKDSCSDATCVALFVMLCRLQEIYWKCQQQNFQAKRQEQAWEVLFTVNGATIDDDGVHCCLWWCPCWCCNEWYNLYSIQDKWDNHWKS